MNQKKSFNLTSMGNIIPLFVFSQCLCMDFSINTINKQIMISLTELRYRALVAWG